MDEDPKKYDWDDDIRDWDYYDYEEAYFPNDTFGDFEEYEEYEEYEDYE